MYENLKVSGFADKCCDKMSITRGRVSEKRDAENIQTRKTQCFQAMGVRLGGLAPLTPPFKQGVRSSNLRRVTTSSRTALVRDGFFYSKSHLSPVPSLLLSKMQTFHWFAFWFFFQCLKTVGHPAFLFILRKAGCPFLISRKIYADRGTRFLILMSF